MLFLSAVLLAGCSQPQAFETMSDVYEQPEVADAAQILLELPEDAATPTMTGEDGAVLYLCDNYCITVQTVPAGDLDATLRQTTGYARDQLQLMEQQDGNCKRYSCVWAAAGEGEDQIGRAVILDDGSYHYVVSVMAGASQAGELSEVWQRLFKSIRLDIAP